MSNPNDFLSHQKKIGLIGGGQLGRMLLQEAYNLNLNIAVLDPAPNAPCKNLCTEFTVGDFKDFDTLYNFGKDKDVITIEFEDVNADALTQLEKDGKEVYPQPRVLKLIQDKGLQKQFYKENNFPTAEFELVENKQEALAKITSYPVFQKLRKSGYDGYGVRKIESADSDIFDAPSVIEYAVKDAKEISVIVARNKKGEVTAFPTVEMEFNPEANMVEFLFSPAKIDAAIEKQATQLAIDIITKLEMVGILAVEMFLTKDNQILVNEIAPRPHNSGHQTIEGNFTSQYAQHLRAILNLPLGDTAITQPSVMINLLGEKGFEGSAHYEGLEEVIAQSGTYIHLYGKAETRSFRKMGHVTVVDNDIEKAKEKARFIKQTLKVVSK